MPSGNRWQRFDTLRTRLVLLILLITSAAVGAIYLYVIPQLESSLTSQKLSGLEASASRQALRLDSGDLAGDPIGAGSDIATGIAGDTEARVTLLEVSPGDPRVLSDSRRPASVSNLETGFRALGSDAAKRGETVAGVTSTSHGKLAAAAAPIPPAGSNAVLILSSPLDEVEANVSLIERQILIAGVIALVAASLIGLWAASSFTRRIGRLQRAAERAAEGEFERSIPIDSADELGRLAETMNRMQRRLARLDTARNEFIANASHELRTPIFSLSGYLELLETGKPTASERRTFLAEMRTQIDRLEELTTDLLDLSKLDAGAMEVDLGEVDVSEVAKEIAAEFATVAKTHRTEIEVRSSGSTKASADIVRVQQIARILIDNALRHTPEGTKVTITAVEETNHVSLIVGDDAGAIPVSVEENLFDRFQTGDRTGGSGLGLPIARQLAERMGGSLELSARRAHTAFTLNLPLIGEAV